MSSLNILALVSIALVFLAVSLLIIGGGRLGQEWLQARRLAHAVKKVAPVQAERDNNAKSGTARRVATVMESLSRLSVPKEGWQGDQVRLRFIQAGLRGETIARNYYAIKTVGTVLVPALIGLVMYYGYRYDDLFIIGTCIFLASATGYYVPDYILKMRTNKRVKEMREVLPDLIDLLVICTESGLALDQSINRVAHEIIRNSRMVGEEFHLVTLEIRAGAGRPTALRNLALRVKLDDLSNFASMLIQADKFGTSIAEALRIQSEVMRVRRMQRAEEMAAKIPTKMLLPLILCIFPVLMLVMLGPAVIQLLGAFEDM